MSADLTELGRTPVSVVCAGVKSILDIGRTLEYLETQGVPVVTLGDTPDFPAFYSPRSGFRSPFGVRSTLECAQLIHTNSQLGLQNGVVVGVPIPATAAPLTAEIEGAISSALAEAGRQGVRGAAVTPFILSYLASHTEGKSLAANIILVKNNAEKGALIARDLCLLRRARERRAGDSLLPSTYPLVSPSTSITSSSVSVDSSASTTSFSSVAPVSAPFSASKVVPQAKQGGKKKSVVVFGGVTVDVLATLKEETAIKTNVGSVERGYGGVGRNLAECIARLGFSPLVVSMIGKDLWGEEIKRGLEDLGMSSRGLVESTKHQTAIFNSISNVRGTTLASVASMEVFDEILPEAIRPHLAELKRASFACMDGNIPSETMAEVAKACHEVNIPLWFEPTSRYKCTKIVTAKALPLLRYLSPTVTELETIVRALGFRGASRDVKASAQFLLDQFPGLTIVCHHHQGVDVASVVNKRFSLESFASNPDTPVLNKTGAGDTLSGGIIAGLLHGLTIGKAVRVGIRAAEATIQSNRAVSPAIDPSFLRVD